MVPVKIALKNFMSYRDASLDMEGVHLACLSGDNGVGKSALLDAITWTLWGEARAGADELMTQGQIEMQTDLEFKIGEELYRVVRTRIRKGAGQTVLSFQIRTPEGGWRNIGEDSVKATQRRIVKELRMEYLTFINSAYLRQGHADEFTIRTPTERKKVLAEILGLSFYDELEGTAKDLSKEAEARRKQLNERLGEINLELERRDHFKQQEQQAATSLTRSQATLDTHAQDLAALLERESALKSRQEQLTGLQHRLEADGQELTRLAQRLEQAATDLDVCREILSRQADIESGYGDYLATEKAYEELLQKFQRYEELVEQRRSLERAIERAGVMLESEQSNTGLQLAEAELSSRNLPELEKGSVALKQEMEEVGSAAEQLERHKASQQQLQTELKLTRQEIGQREEQLKSIQARAEHVPAAGECCDRCGTILDEAARERTMEDRRREYRECKEARKEKLARSEEIEAELAVIEKALRELGAPARKLAELQKRAGGLETQLDQARQAGEKAATLRLRLADLKRQLDQQAFSQTERAALEQNQRDLKGLAYDPTQREKLKSRLDSLKKFEREKNALEDARQRIIRLEEEVQTGQERQERLRQEVTGNQAQAALLEKEVAALPALSAERADLQQLKTTAEAQVNHHRQQLWEAQSQLERLDKLALEKKAKMAEFNEAASQKSIFAELAEAFGKKGVQALIIDTVLPELEDETNRLLHTMSDGRMTVRFDTLRNNKKGESVETLDLIISDEQGPRSYELFSGGEAFRVNFAVRVALSKLLARRSGAALRTLVIDEGFGTQDGVGRERLVEAIRGIEDEFERILVITHIQELKDVFPVRIDVTKTSSGSQISVT